MFLLKFSEVNEVFNLEVAYQSLSSGEAAFAELSRRCRQHGESGEVRSRRSKSSCASVGGIWQKVLFIHQNPAGGL